MIRTRLLACLLLALLAFAGPLRAAEDGEAPPAEKKKPDPPEVERYLEYAKEYLDEEPARVVGTGRIHLRQGDSELLIEDGGVVLWVDADRWRDFRSGKLPADAETLLGATIREVYAEGTVTLRNGGQFVRAERIYANFVEHRAVILKGELLARIGETGDRLRVPLLVRADRIVQTAKNEIRSEKASVTSDLYGTPHHELIVRDLVLRRRGEEVTFSGDSVTVKYLGVPVLWMPRLSASTTIGSDPVRDLDVGTSSKYGYFAGLGLGYRLWSADGSAEEPWGDIEFTPTYRTRRGFGIGGDFEYFPEGVDGRLRGWYQRDFARDDRVLDEPVPQKDRGRIRWQHFQEIDDDWIGMRLHGTAEYSWISDSGFLPEYYTNEFKEDKAQEDVLYLSWAGGPVAVSATGKWQANDWTTQTEYRPRGSFEVFRTPLIRDLLGTGTDLQFGGEMDVASLERVFAEESGEEGARTTRFLARGRIDAPFSLGPVRITPAVGAGTTMYSGEQDHRRLDLFGSVRAAVDFWRVFPDVSSDWFDLNGIRHVMDLSAGYANRFDVSVGSDEIVVQDSYDLVDEIEAVDLRMRHRLETKRRGEIARFVDLELRGLYFPDRMRARPAWFGEREEFRQGIDSLLVPEEETWRRIDRHGWGPILGEFRAQILGNLFLAADAWYDMETRLFETYSEGLRYETEDLSFLVAHRAIQDDSSILTGWIDTKLTERWSVRLLQQTNLTRNKGLAGGIDLRRRLPDFIVEVSARYNQKRNEASFNVTIEPAVVFDRRRTRKQDRYLDFDRMRWYR